MSGESNREIDMNAKYAVTTVLLLCLLGTGCAKSTVRVRKEDGSYQTKEYLVFWPGIPDYRSFNSDEDYMVATEIQGVTYAWPQGKGKMSDNFNQVDFKGLKIGCLVVGRRLEIDGRRFAEFEEGDQVRITGGGEVFVNDSPRQPLSDG